MKTIKALVIAIVFAATAAVTAGTSYANNEASVSHEISMADINHVVLNNSVGSIYVSEGEGDHMQLRVEFEGKRSGMLRRVKDVSDADVTIQERRGVLTVSFGEKNVEATWYVTMPSVAKLNVDLGVGMADISVSATAVMLDVGVGDGKVTGKLEYAGALNADVGVGAATIHGGQDVRSSRAIVAETSSGRGNGEYPISVSVGVGDAGIRLR